MKLFLFKLIGLALILSACGKSQETKNMDVTDIAITIEKKAQIQFSTIFEQVEYIPLETTDTCLVGEVERLRIFNDKLCLLCDKSLLIFNKQTGKYELKLSKLGSAPEEYQSLYDIYIDEKDSCIELLDMNGKKVQKYSINGQFRSTLPLPFRSFSFTKQGDSDYWFYNNNLISDDTTSKVIHYDSEKKHILNEYFPINNHLSKFFFVVEGSNFSNQENGILFFSCACDTIYLLDNKKEPNIAYTINFGQHTTPKEFYNRKFSDIMEFSKEANKQEYVYFINNFSTDKEHILLSFLLDKEYFWSLYNEIQKTTHTGSILKDDINNLSHFQIDNLNTLFAIDHEYLYFLMSAEQFIEISKNNETFCKYIKDNDINEEHNPILVKCKFGKECPKM
jgi:hypothetical protein